MNRLASRIAVTPRWHSPDGFRRQALKQVRLIQHVFLQIKPNAAH
jgi:hypothetical protein